MRWSSISNEEKKSAEQKKNDGCTAIYNIYIFYYYKYFSRCTFGGKSSASPPPPPFRHPGRPLRGCPCWGTYKYIYLYIFIRLCPSTLVDGPKTPSFRVRQVLNVGRGKKTKDVKHAKRCSSGDKKFSINWKSPPPLSSRGAVRGPGDPRKIKKNTQ